MGTNAVRGPWQILAWLWAVLAVASAGATGNRGTSIPPSQPPDHSYDELTRTNANVSAATPATGCPVPPRLESAYDLAQLTLFSKTLFYVRENHPQDITP